MIEIFEHLRFLRYITNSSDPKVQLCSLCGCVGALLTWIMKSINFIASDVMGITVYFTIVMFIIMIVDYITGLLAARKEHEKPSSKKGLRWVFKFGCYVLFIYTLNGLAIDSVRTGIDEIVMVLEIIKYYTVFHIATWELQSIDENFERLGYSFRIFKLFNNIYNMFITVINKKTGVK